MSTAPDPNLYTDELVFEEVQRIREEARKALVKIAGLERHEPKLVSVYSILTERLIEMDTDFLLKIAPENEATSGNKNE